jgi:hypothetical protein
LSFPEGICVSSGATFGLQGLLRASFRPWDLFLPLTSQNLDFSAACSAVPEHAPFIQEGAEKLVMDAFSE